jgi:DNA-binding SARP family transcriptional activator
MTFAADHDGSAFGQPAALPPPLLRVTLMGAFTVVCGNRVLLAADWQRPAAQRLFQYFALHQGRPLPREQILEDLWPEQEPGRARASFKTIYSWMRNAIEPNLPPRAPSRFIQAEQETYTCNPTQSRAVLQCDATDFEQIVQTALATADDHDVRPLPAALAAALAGWQPFLPELHHAPWTIAARERLQSRYVQGCCYAAGAMLDSGRPVDAATWAERALAVAPWSEEAWQELMRAQARCGDHSLALTTYAAAVAALQRELAAPPSPMLAWLAERLRNGERI